MTSANTRSAIRCRRKLRDTAGAKHGEESPQTAAVPAQDRPPPAAEQPAQNGPPGKSPSPPQTSAAIRKLQETALTEWLKSRWISVAALGIAVGVDDAPTLGGVAILVALVWLYLCIRREHYTIAMLLRDYGDDRFDQGTKWAVFHGINLFTVFTTVGHFDEPVTNIRCPPPAETDWRLSKWAIKVMYFLPTAALLAVIALDIASMFMPSPARPGMDPLIRTLINENNLAELRSIAVWDFLSILLLLLVGHINLRITRFTRATEQLLRDFMAQIPDHLRPSAESRGPAGRELSGQGVLAYHE